ncbi:unnamed protein product [Sordaria macrospora k-hell]|uniref:ATP phosphoribosyltransferase n=1 Tax=Sordaria macrospora (strain ATCC MYA-333 / DSM 997 / K(L3346) / K-hell) TaxID=771870 RepID=F7VZR3_SORMK|nr:uncharacterized protein SMAC_08778 [Sordaria macrospora k-hell]CCC11012.1 unnamed protein product [Sordaria macrospora k-hell]
MVNGHIAPPSHTSHRVQDGRLRLSCFSPVRYTLVFHAEPQFVDTVKQAVFAAGAGRYPNYSECCWTANGTGQFRPVGAANPHTGEVGVLEKIEELRVEMLCDSEETARKAVEALKKAHPYEEPSYAVYKLEDF